MRIAGLIKNDVVNGYDVCVSLWTQGCPFHCKECHNPQTWDFEGGTLAFEDDLIEEIKKAIHENGIQRNLSILGGEPLCQNNIEFVKKLVSNIREEYPAILIFVWSGFAYEELVDKNDFLSKIDVLVDGRYEHEQRDLSLPLRGSRNQRVIDIQKTLKEGRIALWRN